MRAADDDESYRRCRFPTELRKAGKSRMTHTKGKTTKKDQTEHKRFDDHKASNIKQGKGSRGTRQATAQQEEAREGRQYAEESHCARYHDRRRTGEAAAQRRSEVIKKLLVMGVMATINQELDLDTIQLVADDYGIEVELKIPVTKIISR